jgi:hypothetical protein
MVGRIGSEEKRVESIGAYLWSAVLATLVQLGLFIVPGLILASIMNFEAGFVERRALVTMGRGWYLGLFGWLGTSVHELGHAIFCLIFRHKITKIKLFDPDPRTGTLGYVEHSYNPANIYQLAGNFFIGIGPILLGTAVIYLVGYFLLGLHPFQNTASLQIAEMRIDSWNAIGQLLQNIGTSSFGFLGSIFSWDRFATWQLYVFIYLAFAIGSSITLSPPDIKSTLAGLSVILVLMFIFNLVTVWAGELTSNIFSRTSAYFIVFYAVMFFTLLMNIAVAGLILLPLSLLKAGHKGS